MFLIRIFSPSLHTRAFTFSCASPADAAERIKRYAARWGIGVSALDWEIVR